MANDQKHREYIKLLCDNLNKAGIKQIWRSPSGDQSIEWMYEGEMYKYIFGGGICNNYTAFKFLKDKGLIDIGICPKCGESPIDNKFKFTDNKNTNINFFICKDCYSKGASLKSEFENDNKHGFTFYIFIFIVLPVIIGAYISYKIIYPHTFLSWILFLVMGFTIAKLTNVLFRLKSFLKEISNKRAK